MQRHHYVWRLVVVHQIASLSEIMTFWDINEVMRANEILDIQEDVEWLSDERAKAQAKK